MVGAARPAAGWLQIHRQFAIDRYVVDFVCWNERLVIEIDGGQHGASAGRDAERTKWLRAQGFSVLRFWNNEVLTNLPGVLTAIAGVLGTSAHPHPSGEGEKFKAGEGEEQRHCGIPLPRGEEGGAKHG